MHLIGGLFIINYAQAYYFHLREYHKTHQPSCSLLTNSRPPQEPRALSVAGTPARLGDAESCNCVNTIHAIFPNHTLILFRLLLSNPPIRIPQ